MSFTVQNNNKKIYGNYGVDVKLNWSIVPHKTMKTPKRDKLLKQIEQVAQKRAQLKSNDNFNQVNYEEERLRSQYISTVSPPRKTLLKQVNTVLKRYKTEKKEPLGYKTLISFLTKTSKSDKSTKLTATIEPIINTISGYDYNVRFEGNIVLSSIKGQWLCVLTPEELKKSHEFNRIFDNAVEKFKQNTKVAKELSTTKKLFSNGNIDLRL
ncbi:hypothetical protein IMX26_15640 [Clostridium sp. 'deep sea']|uniref:hypothetical protein n=1 Tax=Clostridium sp. 'deep sea' TaxID=2779445 RepID=UPI0018968819|nr:hypothetical protein [Clostridium sp. 'deep sea']QOR34873.1 hypothetical protein IMX26_15640 [Clostridium sp. 'deep sea']